MATETETQQESKTNKVKLVSLYFTLRDRMAVLEPMLCEFYEQLMRELGLVDRLCLELDGRELTFTEDLIRTVMNTEKIPPTAADKASASYELRLFHGNYIRLFQDGSAFQKIIYRIFDRLGESKIMWIRWKALFRKHEKSNPKLRTFYQFVDTSFVMQLPLECHTGFQADVLLYGEWRCNHPDLVGMHMLMLAWMLGADQFASFAPLEIRQSVPFTDPLLKLFWPVSGLPRPTPASAAPAAKTSAAKGAAKEAAKGAANGGAKGAAKEAAKGAAKEATKGATKGAAKGAAKGGDKGVAKGDIGTIKGKAKTVKSAPQKKA